MTGAIELFSRLGDDLCRAQRATGIAPVSPAMPMYAQYHGPREAEARRRLAALGYALDAGLGPALALFRDEAAIARTTTGHAIGHAIDQVTWDALDALRGLERDLDVARWRGADRQWLPAMRRAIVVRIDELLLPDPPIADRDPPDVKRASQSLDRLRGLVGKLGADGDPGRLQTMEERLVTMLMCHERLFVELRGDLERVAARATLRNRIAAVERRTLGLVEKLDEHGSGPWRRVLERLRELLPGPLGRSSAQDELGARLFDAVIERPALRRQPSEPEFADLWPHVTRIVSDAGGFLEHWHDFVDDHARIWTGAWRSRSWLAGAATFFREQGQQLSEGILALEKHGRHIFTAAAQLNVARVVYHAFAELFSVAHLAAARFVEFVEFGGRGPIRIERRPHRLRAFADRDASQTEVLTFVAELHRRDHSLRICAELLGLLLGITASWPAASLNVGVVIRSMVKSVPRILHLGRELASTWTPATSAPTHLA